MSKWDPERRSLEEFRKSLERPKPEPTPEPVRKQTRLEVAQKDAVVKKARDLALRQREALTKTAELNAQSAGEALRAMTKIARDGVNVNVEVFEGLLDALVESDPSVRDKVYALIEEKSD